MRKNYITQILRHYTFSSLCCWSNLSVEMFNKNVDNLLTLCSYLKGYIADLNIWARPLSMDEIQNYSLGNAKL